MGHGRDRRAHRRHHLRSAVHALRLTRPPERSRTRSTRHGDKGDYTVKPSQVALVPANNQIPATPSPTESPAEEAASPSPAAPAATPPPAALNNGPIATGTTRDLAGAEHAIIKMKDGSTVEADAAWEDAQGVWYRRSGLVSFVEKSRVEAITEPQRKAAAESKTP